MDAIKNVKGPCVILAGAGTGKTHNIIEKLKYIMENEIYNPKKIVCITFSNEATENIFKRLSREIKSEQRPLIRTFHGFSADLLREYGEKIGIKKDFEILDSDEAKVLLRNSFKISPRNCHEYISSISVARDWGISLEVLEKYLEKKKEKYPFDNLNKIYEELFLKCQTISLGKDNETQKKTKEELNCLKKIIELERFIKIIRGYEKIKKQKNYQDYSDLNNNALKLIENFPEVGKKFDYVIVDEFQDTNKIQIEMLKKICIEKNITVVGDLNQSIYRFRGAYKKNFEEFINHFGLSNKEIFNLSLSRRSSNKILRASHKLILNNYSKKEDCFEVLNFEEKEGEKIESYELINSQEEARKVFELIERETGKGIPFEDICILFRTHQQGKIVKKVLESKKIPFHSATSGSLLKYKDIKIIIAFLNLVDVLKNKKNKKNQYWWEIFYYLNIPKCDLIMLGQFMKKYKDLENFSDYFLSNFNEIPFSQDGKIQIKIMLEKIKLIANSGETDLVKILDETYKILGYSDFEIISEKEKFRNVNKFYELAKRYSRLYYSSLEGFMAYLETLNMLGINLDSSDSERKGVSLMTAHSTKGLEYKVVIVVGMAQKKFPLENFKQNNLLPYELNPEFNNLKDENDVDFLSNIEKENHLNEERRLAYVSFTRAKEKLIFCYAREYGGKNFSPSQFLFEMDYKNNPDFYFELDESKKYEDYSKEPPEENAYFWLNPEKLENSVNCESRGIEITKSDFENISLSPSSLLLFDECEKKYEYKYVYNMPEEKTIFWDSIQLGRFVHAVAEEGVKMNCKDVRVFLEIADRMKERNEWDSINIEEAKRMIIVFFDRNKNKFNEKSKTEQKLDYVIGDFKFIGYADRIDFGTDGIEIIDYKTNKYNIKPRHREWQLGYYALAASKIGKVKKVTLDLLNQEKPLEFELDPEGNAIPKFSSKMKGFNVFEIKKELIETAKKLMKSYEFGFKPCSEEKNCDFCNDYMYKI